MAPPERSAERDAAIDAMVALVPTKGWTFAALRGALSDAGGDPRDAELLFPGGATDMIEAFIDLTDRRTEAAAATLSDTRVSRRVRGIIAGRLAMTRRDREAIRRAWAVLALPRNAGLAARCTARTVDSIWHAAGDRSADFSWYSKRAILAAIYGATVLYWLRDQSEDDAATLAFLDRRLAGLGRVAKLRARAEAACARLLPRRATA